MEGQTSPNFADLASVSFNSTKSLVGQRHPQVSDHVTLILFNGTVPYLCFLLELDLCLSVSVEHKCKVISRRDPDQEGMRGEVVVGGT